MLSTKERQKIGLRQLRASSARYVVGVDEVGTGCLAGPFVVAAVVAKREWQPPHTLVRDSKKCSPSKRTHLVRNLLMPPNIEDCWLVRVEPEELSEEHSLGRCLVAAIQKVVTNALSNYPNAIVVADGEHVPSIKTATCLAFPKADDLVPAVSAASIIAKVFRDGLMEEYSKLYPEYGFERHKGYGTEQHLAAIEKYGVCPIHRRAYQPIKTAMEREAFKQAKEAAKVGGWPPRMSETRGSTLLLKP